MAAIRVRDRLAKLDIAEFERHVKEGEFYRLRDQADDRRYESVRFVRKSDSELIDEGSNLGTITAGGVAFGDGRRAKSAILRVNFCYEMYLLIDTRAEGMFP